MTVAPPPPPSPPARDLRPWIAFGGGVAVVLIGVVAVLLVDRLGGDDASTATTVAADTTVATSTIPETTTVAAVSTEPGAACAGSDALIHDRFEDAVCPFPGFGDLVGGVTHVGGVGEVRTNEGYLFFAVYPQGPIGDAEISLSLRPMRAEPGDAYGVVFLAQDPHNPPSTSFNPPTFVRVSVVPASQEVVAYAYQEGGGPSQVEPIPPAAGLDPTGWNTLEIVVAGGGFTVSVNGVPVMNWVQPLPNATGYLGLAIGGNVGTGFAMQVDDFVVRVP